MDVYYDEMASLRSSMRKNLEEGNSQKEGTRKEVTIQVFSHHMNLGIFYILPRARGPTKEEICLKTFRLLCPI